jgi:hypothetical protein
MGTRVKVRADSMRLSSAEYLRALIENDLKKGRAADALAQLNTEITLVIGMMLREWLTPGARDKSPRAARQKPTTILSSAL